ncbi:prepilin peptidase (plasmid) [Rhizobium sp. TH2]|uniref:prepilin peptidase n=1 Tax=Rhizobium sp. TH2 TaxID=2775403 RepID=UPI0021583409|nr:A24 family peptidase [Rhizobium sp. TH2]UVC12613.1 prepilin peptidase [Rhizobium sp. TH2]
MVRSLNAVELLAIMAAGLLGSLMLVDGGISDSWFSVAVMFVTAMAIWIAVRDFRDFIIPDGPLIALAMTGALMRLAGTPDPWPIELAFLLLDAVACGGVFLVIREVFFHLRGHDGMGFGDVKLAAASGILLGYEGFAWSVFSASALGLIFAIGLTTIRPDQRMDRLPFGALLAPACWSIWVLKMSGVI